MLLWAGVSIASRFRTDDGREPPRPRERRCGEFGDVRGHKVSFCLKALERATEAAIQRAARRS